VHGQEKREFYTTLIEDPENATGKGIGTAVGESLAPLNNSAASPSS
jgi:hypothetical protein